MSAKTPVFHVVSYGCLLVVTKHVPMFTMSVVQRWTLIGVPQLRKTLWTLDTSLEGYMDHLCKINLPNLIADLQISLYKNVCPVVRWFVWAMIVTATKSSVPFGGFFSCQSGNPLSNGQSRCPPQFSQHLAAVSDGCEILYCVQSSVFSGGQVKPVRLLPFTSPPLIGMTATNSVAVITKYCFLGESWTNKDMATGKSCCN